MKYLAAGVVTDIAAFLMPIVLRYSLLGALAGALIGASWLPIGLLVDRLAGMDIGAALQHTALKLASAMLFGAAGGSLRLQFRAVSGAAASLQVLRQKLRRDAARLDRINQLTRGPSLPT